jgi:intein/homing endonuclease
MEDSLVIYRISRAPERRIFYIDVGNLPKMKAEQYLRDQMTRFKNKLVYDSGTGEVRDDRKFMCYSMDTRIPLLDGRTLELQEIIKEFNEGKKNWVYSCDPVTGKFYPGPISWAGITKTDAKVVKVTFDNGKSVICTPDHKFPVWNKGFVEAQHLTYEDSIIPGYRRKQKLSGNSNVEYEQIYLNDTQTWEFTHREVSKWKDSVDLTEEFVYDETLKTQNKTVIHHKNFNGLNNNPENLVKMNHKDHNKFHKENQSIVYNDEILRIFEYCARNLMTIDETLIYINSHINLLDWSKLNKTQHVKNRNINDIQFTYKDMLRLSRSKGFKAWKAYVKSFDLRERETNGRIKRSITVPKYSEEWKKKLSVAAKGRQKHPTSKTWKIFTPTTEIEIVENLNEYCRKNGLNKNLIKTKGSLGYKAEILRNHKIISVTFLDETMNVGSMSIDTNETYHSHHTYLLDAGVYTKNTMLEDFWLPRREGKGTEITTLPGGQNLGQIEDIVYFQKKLYQSLNVPVSRLDTETQFGFGRSNEITRDEVKFSKFINRLRNRFATLFTKLLEKQLVLKGIITYEEWEQLKNQIRYKFSQDNYYAELKETEILRDRITMLRDIDDYAGKFYSHEWIRRHVLRQTDEEMEEIDAQIKEEVNNPQYAPPMPETPDQTPPEEPQPVGSQKTIGDQTPG